MQTLEQAIEQFPYLPARVQRGIDWLTKQHNGDLHAWLDKIDILKLDMEDGVDCILGQVYHDQWKERQALHPFDLRYANSFSYVVNRLVSDDDVKGYDHSSNMGRRSQWADEHGFDCPGYMSFQTGRDYMRVLDSLWRVQILRLRDGIADQL